MGKEIAKRCLRQALKKSLESTQHYNDMKAVRIFQLLAPQTWTQSGMWGSSAYCGPVGVDSKTARSAVDACAQIRSNSLAWDGVIRRLAKRILPPHWCFNWHTLVWGPTPRPPTWTRVAPILYTIQYFRKQVLIGVRYRDVSCVFISVG